VAATAHGGKDRYRGGVAERACALRVATVAAAVGATVVLGAAPSADAAGISPAGPTETGYVVTRVVDGDTIHVGRDGVDLTVRLIGINSPESVKPNSPVECFGPQASDFAKAALTGRTVRLEFDASQGRTDQYGRTLAYVWVERPGSRPTLFNQTAVRRGYAFERQYGPTPYAWRSVLRAAQKQAQSAHAGLWSACH
jgi:micrococcal nuclease